MTLALPKLWKSRPLRVGAMFFGNIFEHIDTALYSFLCPFIAPLFFPTSDPLTGLILAFVVMRFGLLARLSGAFYFGMVGDLKGRLSALKMSLFGMTGVTLVIAFLPTYETAGLMAPFLLALMRALQGFFASAQTGCAIAILETVKQRDMFSALFSASSVVGCLFASLGVSILHYFGSVEQYWRILYIIGGGAAICGVLLRFSIEEEPLSKASVKEGLFEMWRYVKEHKRTVAGIALIAGFSTSCFSMAFSVLTSLIPFTTSLSKEESIDLNSLFLIVDCLLLPLFGYIATRSSRLFMMRLFALLIALLGPLLFLFLHQATLSALFIIRLIVVILGIGFSSSVNAWKLDLVPRHLRFRILTLSSVLGTQVVAGPTVALSLLGYQFFGVPAAGALYWAFLGLSSLIVLSVKAPLKAPDCSIA